MARSGLQCNTEFHFDINLHHTPLIMPQSVFPFEKWQLCRL